MTPLSWAWFAVAVLCGVALLALSYTIIALSRVLDRTRHLIDGVAEKTVPLIGDVNTTINLVNQELARVDGILGRAEQVSSSVGNLVEVVADTVRSPLVKVSAFAWGLRKAARKVAETEEGPEPRGRFRRRRR